MTNSVSVIGISVFGIPAPQGSKRHVGNGRLVESSKALKAWRRAVTVAARNEAYGGDKILGPVHVEIVFYLPKPKTVRRMLPWKRPDLDKLVRGVFDGITDAGTIWHDDGQAVKVTAEKFYCTDVSEPGMPCKPGAFIAVSSLCPVCSGTGEYELHYRTTGGVKHYYPLDCIACQDMQVET